MMKSGFSMLASACPSAAPSSSNPNGLIKLITPGDRLMAAFGEFRAITFAAMIVTVLNISLSIFTLDSFRRKTLTRPLDET